VLLGKETAERRHDKYEKRRDDPLRLHPSQYKNSVGGRGGGNHDANWLELSGWIVGWIMSLLYLSSRLPQISQMMKSQSVDGLSTGMFALTMSGNAAFVISILSRSLDMGFILEKLPWLVDAIGTIVQDCFVLMLFSKFRSKQVRKLGFGSSSSSGGLGRGRRSPLSGLESGSDDSSDTFKPHFDPFTLELGGDSPSPTASSSAARAAALASERRDTVSPVNSLSSNGRGRKKKQRGGMYRVRSYSEDDLQTLQRLAAESPNPEKDLHY
jgi:uncharacterized protein with PQ loop repeat